MIHSEARRRSTLEREYAETMEWRVARPEPLVSAVVTTYQQADVIERCLDGILAQRTDFPFEVVIGEDGSTDGTRERCIEYATRQPGLIRLFLRSREEAVYETRGRRKRLNGIWSRQAARGAFIALCDGDDYWTDPLKLQKQVDFLQAHPECASCFHAVDLDDRTQGVLRKNVHPAPPLEGPHYSLDDLLRLGNFIFTSSEMYRNVPAREDQEWFYALPYRDFARHALAVANGRQRWIGYIPDSMAVYRRHAGGSWFSRGRSQQLADEIEVYAVLGERLDIEQRAEWRRAFSRLLASHVLEHPSPRTFTRDMALIWRKSPRLAAGFALRVLPGRALDRLMKRASNLRPAVERG